MMGVTNGNFNLVIYYFSSAYVTPHVVEIILYGFVS